MRRWMIACEALVLLVFVSVDAKSGVPSRIHDFAQIGDGGGLRTVVLVMNQDTDGGDCGANLNSYDDSGAPWPLTVNGVTSDSHYASVAFGGTAIFVTGGETSPPQSGWARVSSECEMAAQVLFEIRVGETLVTQAAVESTGPLRIADLFIDLSEGTSTGLAVASLSQAGRVKVYLELFDPEGVSQGKRSITLAPLGHTAQFFPEIFQGLQYFRGKVRLRATGPVAVTTLQQTGLVLGTLPPIIATERVF